MSCLTTLRYDPTRQKQVIIGSIVGVLLLLLIIILAATLAPRGASHFSELHRNSTNNPNDSLLCTDKSKLEEVYDIPKLRYETAAVGRGYNLLKGNPHFTTGDSLDPGLKSPIFDLSKKYCGKVTPDDRYQVPEHIAFSENTKCSLKFAINTYNSSLDYVQHLAERIIIDPSNGTFDESLAFIASKDYQAVKEFTHSKYGYMAEACASCGIYVAQLETSSDPPLTDEFKSAVEKLPSDDSQFDKKLQTNYYQFSRSYGTHYVTSVVFGSMYGEMFNMSMQQWWQLTRSPLADGATLDQVFRAFVKSHLIGEGEATGFTSKDRRLIDNYGTLYESEKLFKVGQFPPENLKAEDWIEETLKDPKPFNFQVSPITTLLTSQHFPDDKKIEAKRELLERAFSSYCSDIAKITQIVDSCDPPQARPVAPIHAGDGVSLRYLSNNLTLGTPHLDHGTFGQNFLQYAVFGPTALPHTIQLADEAIVPGPLKHADVVRIQALWVPIPPRDGQNFLTRSVWPKETFKIAPSNNNMTALKMANYEPIIATGTSQLWKINKFGDTKTESAKAIMPGDIVNFNLVVPNGEPSCWLQAFDSTTILDSGENVNIPKHPFLVVCGQPNAPPKGWIIQKKDVAP